MFDDINQSCDFKILIVFSSFVSFYCSQTKFRNHITHATFFNSRIAIAGAIVGLLLVFFITSLRFLLRPYDVTITSNLLFVHLFMQFQLKCVFDIIFCSLWSEFFLFICVIKFLVTLDLPHSQE